MNNKILISFFLAVFLISNVYGLGLSPARNTVTFESGVEKEFELNLINGDKEDMELNVYAKGELEDYIEFEEEKFYLSSSEDSKKVRFKLKTPNQLKPGIHKSDIVIMQVPDEINEDGAVIGVALAVISQLVVEVPYPGKYIEALLNVNGASVGQDIQFIIPMRSMGEADIVSVRANIDIYNKLNEKIDSFNTDSISLESGAERELIGKWKADAPIGTYLAKVTLIYDGETLNMEKLFNIGEAELELEEVSVRDFSLGQIAKLEMLVENKWGEEVKDAYTLTKIYNEEGNTLSEFKSPTYDIPALQKSVMVSYWDSAGYSEGDYDASVYLNYGEKSTQKDLTMKVSSNRVEFVGLGYVISEKGKSSGNGVNTLLVIIIVVLVLVNLLWFMMLRKKLFAGAKK
jgi:hypothetical protein